MRLALTACAGAVFLFGAFSFAQKGAAAPSPSAAVEPVTVAQGVSARGFTFAPSSELYLTLATTQDRVFSLNALPPALLPAKSTASPSPLAGNGTSGSLGDGGNALSAQLSLSTNLSYERSGIAVAADGTIYIADTQNSTIRSIAGPGSSEPGIIRSIVGRWASPQNVTLSQPLGLALDRAGDLYIADHSAGSLDILRHDTGSLESVAQIASPATVAVSADGNEAYVASPETASVIAVDLHTKSLRVVEQAPTGSDTGQNHPCLAPDGSQPARPCPSGLAVDGAGNLFVSDLIAGTIVRFDAHTGASSTLVTGLLQPGAIAFNQQGRDLYISEQGASRIVVAQALGTVNTNLTLSPTTAPFPNEPIAGISNAQQFTLTNNTSSTVSGLQISPAPPTQNGVSSSPADFTTQSTSCLTMLAPGAICNITVAFTPTSMGPRSASLTVTDAGSDTASASLSGTGDDYQLALGSGQLQEISVTQGRSATFNLQVAALGVFGQNGEKVSLVCPSGTPAQTTCTVTPTSGSPTSATPATFTVTFQTSSKASQAQSAPLPSRRFPGLPDLLISIVFGISALVWFGFAHTSRRWIRLVMLATSPVGLLVGCHNHGPTATPTPTGAANITIQASAFAQNGTPLNATRSLTVTLDVLQ